LIVLCSPASAKSAAVNEEVRLFKHRRADRPIVPVILSGKPDGGEQECFPPALRFELDAEGRITDNPAPMALAADVREEGDGRELALAKVAAALVGVPSDEVYRRAERERKQQALIRNAIAAVILILASVGGYFSFRSYTQQRTLSEIETLVNELAPTGSAQARQGGRQALTAAIKSIAKSASFGSRQAQAYQLLKDHKLKEAETLLRALAEEEKARIAADRKQAAEAYRNLGAIAGLGDPKRAREYYTEAVNLDPEDREALYWTGYLSFLAGNLSSADEALSALLKQAAVAGDDKALYRAEMRLGQIDKERGSLTTAMERERRALAIAERHVKAAPSDAEWQRELSVCYIKVGDVLVAQGNLPEAIKAYRDSLAIFERLAKSDPGNAKWQRDLSVANIKVGDVLVAQGNLADALNAYRDSLAIAERLAKADPGNA
jgi:tetratricopeptide (TPR) repeat protein